MNELTTVDAIDLSKLKPGDEIVIPHYAVASMSLDEWSAFLFDFTCAAMLAGAHIESFERPHDRCLVMRLL